MNGRDNDNDDNDNNVDKRMGESVEEDKYSEYDTARFTRPTRIKTPALLENQVHGKLPIPQRRD